ncbi:MAG: helix-turn-helix domain-containing protein [Bacillota bacterium]
MLGEKLSKLRKNKGLSQAELARLLGMSRSTYAQYEIDRRNPDYETLSKMASFFGVSTDWLLGRSNNSKRVKWKESSRLELEEILKESNVYFNNAPLDEEDKEDLLELVKLALKRKRKGR